MLEVKKLIYSYEGEDFCFDISAKKAQITVVLGKSGVGKSTLLSLIAGFLRPDSGDILLNGKSILNQKPNERDLSILFQENNLFEHLSLYENIALGINPRLKLSEAQKAQLIQKAKIFGIDTLLKKLPNEVSGGQKQRAALCRTVLRQKSLLLLDEPYSALDGQTKKTLLQDLVKITKEQNLIVLMVTHDESETKMVASKVIRL